jgi:hypothetical protein
MLVNSKWETIRKLYSKYFGYSEDYIDYLAIKDILKLTCMGYSYYKIARRLKMDSQYVLSVLNQYFDNDGLNYDLGFSPLAVYKISKDLDEFTQYINSREYYVKNYEISYLFNICKNFFDYEEKYNGN